ncbi:sialidase family protein [Synoicihabitans lomoniglobus]|uniref:Exo-alpha-sialidase n=1 Tax=Synoicihabitans lomoniglobus TaxID=2909285 RepID=A0AAE9ZV64_9BACT|nr:exo-alpha-sialidase [Opitutaceae bacterium LMO-M01]WED63400.1 exo-alpha-sialidase [Opitutaceae bacterium LMO-M01]
MKSTFFSSRFCRGLLLGCLWVTGRVEAASPVVEAGFIYDEAPFPQCHASTIVETTRGTVLAAFFGGTHEKNRDVGIWLSRHEAKGWTPPVEVADGIQYYKTDGTAARHPTWNPVLFQPRRGPLMLFYKAGPNPRDWWGMLMTSTDDGRNWSTPQRLPEGVLGPIKNKPVQLADGTIVCPSSAESEETGWTVHLELTRDLGRTWTIVGPINTQDEFNAIQPSVLFHEDGRLQVLCRSKESVVTTSWSADQGRTWSAMTATELPNPNSGTDAVTLADGRQLLVYNPTTRLANGWGGPRSPLNVAISDDGVAWHDVAVLETDDAKHGYSYPAVIQTSDGLVHITYTWRREKVRHVVLDPRKFDS